MFGVLKAIISLGLRYSSGNGLNHNLSGRCTSSQRERVMRVIVKRSAMFCSFRKPVHAQHARDDSGGRSLFRFAEDLSRPMRLPMCHLWICPSDPAPNCPSPKHRPIYPRFPFFMCQPEGVIDCMVLHHAGRWRYVGSLPPPLRMPRSRWEVEWACRVEENILRPDAANPRPFKRNPRPKTLHPNVLVGLGASALKPSEPPEILKPRFLGL